MWHDWKENAQEESGYHNNNNNKTRAEPLNVSATETENKSSFLLSLYML